MNIFMERVTAAKDEAKRFLKKVENLEKSGDLERIWASKNKSAVKRASMDLTRALVGVRRGNY